MSEFAPGIPEKKGQHPFPKLEAPKTFEFSLQKHQAERAGRHFDLRLGDPSTGHAHSWAMRYWPKPGEQRLAVVQPTHTVAYQDFSGELGPGYGEGKVELVRREKTEIVSSSPGHVRFNLYLGKGAEEFLLRRTDPSKGHWLLKNITQQRGEVPIEQKKDAVRFAHEAVGRDFSALAAIRGFITSKSKTSLKERLEARKATGVFCGSLVAAAYPRVGWGKPSETVIPRDLAESPKTHLVATVEKNAQKLASFLEELGAILVAR